MLQHELDVGQQPVAQRLAFTALLVGDGAEDAATDGGHRHEEQDARAHGQILKVDHGTGC